MKFNPVLLAPLLTGLLLSSPGTAQQAEAEAEPKDVEQTVSKQEPGESTPDTALADKPRTPTRFIPTEKIHADDAVSFPVDI